MKVIDFSPCSPKVTLSEGNMRRNPLWVHLPEKNLAFEKAGSETGTEDIRLKRHLRIYTWQLSD